MRLKESQSPYNKTNAMELGIIRSDMSKGKKIAIVFSGIVLGFAMLITSIMVGLQNNSIDLSKLLTKEEIAAFSQMTTDSSGNKFPTPIEGFNAIRTGMENDEYSHQKYLVKVKDLDNKERLAICEASSGDYLVKEKDLDNKERLVIIGNITSYIELSTGQIIAQVHDEHPYSEDNCALCAMDKGCIPGKVKSVYAIPLKYTEGKIAGQIYDALRNGEIDLSTLHEVGAKDAGKGPKA
jgi:hypothetical protein